MKIAELVELVKECFHQTSNLLFERGIRSSEVVTCQQEGGGVVFQELLSVVILIELAEALLRFAEIHSIIIVVVTLGLPTDLLSDGIIKELVKDSLFDHALYFR